MAVLNLISLSAIQIVGSLNVSNVPVIHMVNVVQMTSVPIVKYAYHQIAKVSITD